ncbi:MAG: recombinase RecT [Propionibacteriaceae bacterium]|nr:recombinase RecT [Propionibacteriaceae bacterium]
MSQNMPARRANNTPARPNPAAAEQTVKDLVRGSWDAITGSLPETMDGKRFARLVFNAVRKTPRLAQASANSMLGSVLTASALGLEIGLNNEAHLVPYQRKDKNSGREWIEAQLIVGYGGIVKLFQQHPMARGVNTQWVGANDHFEYEYGTSSRLEHRPRLGDRGKPIAFWASYELANGVRDFLVLDVATVARLRGKGENEKRDIEDPEHWMERKTVLKQVLKLAPKSTSLQWAMAVDEKPGGELQAERTHAAISAGDVLPEDPAVVDGGLVEDIEDVDLETGEIVDPSRVNLTPQDHPETVPEEAPAAPRNVTPKVVKAATVRAIVRELERCGVDPKTADAYLPVLGVPADRIADLSQEDAEDLLKACTSLDRDKLAGLMADAAGGEPR